MWIISIRPAFSDVNFMLTRNKVTNVFSIGWNNLNIFVSVVIYLVCFFFVFFLNNLTNHVLIAMGDLLNITKLLTFTKTSDSEVWKGSWSVWCWDLRIYYFIVLFLFIYYIHTKWKSAGLPSRRCSGLPFFNNNNTYMIHIIWHTLVGKSSVPVSPGAGVATESVLTKQ